MENTYTYIARSANDPDKTATFTLHDHQLTVQPGQSVETVGRLIQKRLDDGEMEPERPLPWLKPLFVWVLQKLKSPFDVSDIDVRSQADDLRVRAWVRAGGRRLAPVDFSFEAVDNPEATGAFIEEVNERKATSSQAGRSGRLFDYWLTWAAIPALFLSLWMLLRRNPDSEEAAYGESETT